MLKLLADEDFDNDILRGVKRRNPLIDLIRVQDTEAAGKPDTFVLAWAARSNRVLLTHDVNSLLICAFDRVTNGLPMSGVAALSQSVTISTAIDEVLLIAECSEADDWAQVVQYLPL